jgi:Fibrobacter succinogenes major domain (Fib_succ_major).
MLILKTTTTPLHFAKLAIFLLVVMLIAGCVTVNEPIFGDSVTDVDGNVYHTVTIGTQTWMIENLSTTRLNDSTVIPSVKDSATWRNLQSLGYCWYNNNDSLPEINKYGILYNWYAVATDKLAPKGWHIPTKEDWSTLEKNAAIYNYLSGSLPKILAAKTNWQTSTVSSTIGSNLTKNNSSGFDALPAGFRNDSTAHFSKIGSQGVWWSSALYNLKSAWCFSLTYNATYTETTYKALQSGFSVRCIKDSE